VLVCGSCDGLLREPRHASSCEHYISTEGLTEACCPHVDASKPPHEVRPFEAMVNSTVVRCPTSTAERGGPGGYILTEPAACREASGSLDRSLGSVQAPGVEEEEAGDGGGNAPPRAGGVQETCGWTGNLGALAEHLVGCRFAMTKCTHAGCSAKEPRKDMGAHEAECVWRGGECERCGSAFTPGEPRVNAHPKHPRPFTVSRAWKCECPISTKT
jgi:hypothetical protein